MRFRSVNCLWSVYTNDLFMKCVYQWSLSMSPLFLCTCTPGRSLWRRTVPFLRVSWQFYNLSSFFAIFLCSSHHFDIQTRCPKGVSIVAQDLGAQFRWCISFNLCLSLVYSIPYMKKSTWNVPKLYLNTNYVPNVPNF